MEFDARIAAFVLLSALLIVTPGPDTALIIRNALAAGPRASTSQARARREGQRSVTGRRSSRDW